MHRRLFCEASHGAPKLDEDVLKDASKENNNMPNGGNFPAAETVPVEENNNMPNGGNFPAEETVPVEISAAWHAIRRRSQDALDSIQPKYLLVGILRLT